MKILAVTNLYPSPHDPASGTFVEQQIKGLEEIGLQVDVLVVDRVLKGMRAYLGLGSRVKNKIFEYQSDLVHVFYGGIMADEVTRSVLCVPTVVSFCGSDLLGQPLAKPLRRFIASYGVWASQRAARRAVGIVVKSRHLRDALPRRVDRNKVRIIPSGINLDRFKPLERSDCLRLLGWHGKSFHVLFAVTGGDPVKRPELAKAAVEIAKRSGIRIEFHELQNVSHDQVPIWLNASDVVLLTSLHEGSPNIVKEALACNIPVVSVDVGDVRQRIQGIAGCYLASPEPHDLAGKIVQVCAGSRRVEGRIKMQELSLERVALRLKEFYGEVLVYSKSQLSTEALATS